MGVQMDRPKIAYRSCHWLVCSRREDAVRLGKAPLQSGINLIAAGSQPIVRRRANEPSSWVVNCLVMVERSWLNMKRFMMVQGRPLRTRVFLFDLALKLLIYSP